jgi:hypothetical protein
MNVAGAVITADIVNSSSMGKKSYDLIVSRLKKILSAEKVKSHFYRGDSFQCYLADPYTAFRFALNLRTAAKVIVTDSGEETDLKISLGIGSIETPVIKINEAMGEAFIISGRELDNLEIEGRRFIITSENSGLNIAFDTISIFTDYLFKKLTLKQAEVLKYLLKNNTQQQIARKLKKTQSTVNRHVQALGWKEFEHLIENYNKCILKING